MDIFFFAAIISIIAGTIFIIVEVLKLLKLFKRWRQSPGRTESFFKTEFFFKLAKIIIVVLLLLLLPIIGMYYFSKPNTLEEWAIVLVHDLEKDIKTTQGIYVHPLTLSVLHERKSHLDIFDSALRDALNHSEWLVPLNPSEKLSSADFFFLRQQAKCGTLSVYSPCKSLVADLIQADSELSGKVQINKEQVNVNITLTNNQGLLITTNIIAHASVDFPKSLLSQEKLKQLESLENAEIPSKGSLQIEMSTSHGAHNVTYSHGESLHLFIRTNQAAYIYVFVIDAQNRSTLLYPESRYDEPKKQEADKLFILPEDGLPHYPSLPIKQPFGLKTLWAVAVTTPIQFPEEMYKAWHQADSLRQQMLRQLGLADSNSNSEDFGFVRAGYAEAKIVVETIGPTDEESKNELDSLLD